MRREESAAMKRDRVLRARSALNILKRLFPRVGMMLNYRTHWELLVAVQLSAQCTDKKVNEVTRVLFARYPRFSDYLSADPREFEELIHATGFFRVKTRNILAAARYLHEHHGGRIPKTMKEMLRIPGVARKTANVVLGNAHGVVEGIAVDTHVRRLSRLLGLTDESHPERIERDLMEIFPRDDWFLLTYYFIEYGRKYCPARPHDEARCPLGHPDPYRLSTKLSTKRTSS
jgi:endonuclease-3